MWGPRRESRLYVRWHVSEGGAIGTWEFYQEPVESSVWLGTLDYSRDSQGMQTLTFRRPAGEQWVVNVTTDGRKGALGSTHCGSWIPCNPVTDQITWENGHGTWFHGFTDVLIAREW